jgi:hypothetical protein
MHDCTAPPSLWDLSHCSRVTITVALAVRPHCLGDRRIHKDSRLDVLFFRINAELWARRDMGVSKQAIRNRRCGSGDERTNTLMRKKGVGEQKRRKRGVPPLAVTSPDSPGGNGRKIVGRTPAFAGNTVRLVTVSLSHYRINGLVRLSLISGRTHVTRQHEAVHPTTSNTLCPPTFSSTIIQIHPSNTNKPLVFTFMSQTHPTAASSSSSSSNFQLIINNALNTYKQRTKNDLGAHPLAVQFQSCDSPSAILAVLHEQVYGLEQSRNSDERWTKWLDPTVDVLYAFSGILGSGVSLVRLRTCTCLICFLIFMLQLFSPASVIFAGIGVLLSVCILINFAWAIITHPFLRLLKMFEQAKTLLSTSLRGSGCFSDASRFTQKCGRPRK